VRVEKELGPEELLDACKVAERARGRQPGGVRHGPRPLDVDLLLLGDLEYTSARLTLPHRETTGRRFVLVPLLELDPGLAIPGRGPAAGALAALGDEGAVRRAGPPLRVQ
jgi:2-amino-4-hydroxy-6-hydroxymethyldihydropteridine diphosphokinase